MYVWMCIIWAAYMKPIYTMKIGENPIEYERGYVKQSVYVIECECMRNSCSIRTKFMHVQKSTK